MNAKVRDVMTPGPIGVDYYQSIGTAAQTMRDWGIGAVLVVHDQALQALVTDRDLVVRAVAESKGPDEPVGPLSSRDLIGVNADDDAAVAARLMRDTRAQAAGDRGRAGRRPGVARRPGPAGRSGLRPGRARQAGAEVTMTRKVRDIMWAAPACMAATESVSAAARVMKERGLGTVLVMDDGRLAGLVTDRDITIRVLAENRDPLTTHLGDICATELAVLGPDNDVQQATRLVRDRAVRRLQVIADGVPVAGVDRQPGPGSGPAISLLGDLGRRAEPLTAGWVQQFRT